MNLVIIEGSGKRDTIKKYLGPDYEVFATNGHIRDLPLKNIGVDTNNNFDITYQIMPDKTDIVKNLKNLAKKADKIFLAPDPDREGEAISYHIAHILELDKDLECRTSFNAITKAAILESLSKPTKINFALVDAQQARRVVDRLMGYKISPFISRVVKPKLSAGRVQSVALKLIVDREKEIMNFKEEEYWTLTVNLEKESVKPSFNASLYAKSKKKLNIKNKAEMDAILNELKSENYLVDSIKKSVTKSSAPAPFITSTLLQDAGNKLSMSLKMAQRTAQELYEGVSLGEHGKTALLTYIRTDSPRVTPEAQAMAKNFILKNYGNDYYPTKPNVFKSKAGSQDAHECIRPISLEITPDMAQKYLSRDHYRMYKLVYERFLASQMSNATFDSCVVEIKCGDYNFKATGKTPNFLGYTVLYKAFTENEEKDEKLPALNENDLLKLINEKAEQKFTKPPTRYNESSLINAMEKKEIGRPATYPPTILTLYNRDYAEKVEKRLKPTDLGMNVSDHLEKHFSNMINVEFTASMENSLDEIADGKKNYLDVVTKFYNFFEPTLQKAYDTSEKRPPAELTDIMCEKCGSPMAKRSGKYGEFLGCSNYPKCKNIISNTPTPEKPVHTKTDIVCPLCSGEVVIKKTRTGKEFYSCNNFPKCKFATWDTPIGSLCEKCKSPMVEKINQNNEKNIVCSNAKCK